MKSNAVVRVLLKHLISQKDATEYDQSVRQNDDTSNCLSGALIELL